MDSKKREKAEKAVMLSALAFMGYVIFASAGRKAWKQEIPIYDPEQGRDEQVLEKDESLQNTFDFEKKQQEKAEELTIKEAVEAREDILENRSSEGFPADEAVGDVTGARQETGTDTIQGKKRQNTLSRPSDFLEESTKAQTIRKKMTSFLWKEEAQDVKEPRYLSCESGMQRIYCTGASLKKDELCVTVFYSDGSKCRLLPEMFQVEDFSTEKPGSYQGTICYQGLSLPMPYEVVDFCVLIHLNGGAFKGDTGTEYDLYDYTLETIDETEREGYYFDGWYLDDALTERAEFPFHSSEQETHLYAGWKRREYSYSFEDGILMLLHGYQVISGQIFSEVSGYVEEIYLGEEVSVVQEGAFLGLNDLNYIDVDWKNPNYATINCALYEKGGKTLVAYPNALTGKCQVYAGTERLGKYCFAKSSISTVILPKNLKEIEGSVFGKNLKILRFQGMTPSERIAQDAFLTVAADLVIEVPESAVDKYRRVFEKISPVLAEKVTGYDLED